MPFDPHDPDYLTKHFEDHGSDFGATTPAEYEAMADNFMSRELIPPMRECVRNNGARCRYNPATEEYGVINSWGQLKTYFRPVPCAEQDENDDSECHGFATNWDYFWFRCGER